MPNWCANSLNITALNNQGNATLETFRRELLKDEPRIFNAIAPIHEDLHIVKGFLGNEESQKELEAMQAANIAKHGYATWYDFCVSEWGCKWEPTIEKEATLDEGDSITLYFDTAWAPPIGIYQKLMGMGVSVEATYCEQGMGFAGYWIDGKDSEHKITFLDNEHDEDAEDKEESFPEDAMFSWFAKQGLSHTPSHLGG
jgi:hypothetical protein